MLKLTNNILTISVNGSHLSVLFNTIDQQQIDLLELIKSKIEDLFESACKEGNLNVADWLYRTSLSNGAAIDIHKNDEYIFRYACNNGHKNIAEWLYELSETEGTAINIHIIDEAPFRYACENGHLEVAEWLYCLSVTKNTVINIHARDEFAFRYACYYGHKNVAEWLYSISQINSYHVIDIHTHNNHAFKTACRHGYKNIAEWLCGLDKNYIIIYSDCKMIPYIQDIKKVLSEKNEFLIKALVEKSKDIKQLDDICMVCLNNDASHWIKLDCDHELCSDCFQLIEKCPMRCKNLINLSEVKLMTNRSIRLLN